MLDISQIGSKPIVEHFKLNGVSMVTVPYDITEISPGVYTWKDLTIKSTDYNYGGLVDTLIAMKYSPSSMVAVINNYLLDPADDTYKAEFSEMQEWRKQAKKIAKSILENID